MFFGHRCRLTAATLLAVAFSVVSVAQEPKLEQLLKRTPLPGNAVCYLHTPSLKKLLANANIEFGMADEVEEVWLVSELETNSMHPTWEAGFATVKRSFDAESLAQAKWHSL